jgi:hypothetical protein
MIHFEVEIASKVFEEHSVFHIGNVFTIDQSEFPRKEWNEGNTAHQKNYPIAQSKGEYDPSTMNNAMW